MVAVACWSDLRALGLVPGRGQHAASHEQELRAQSVHKLSKD